MKNWIWAMLALVCTASPAFAVQVNEYMDPLDAKFKVQWFQCAGPCCDDDGLGGCTPNPTGCQTILNECSYPIEVKCGMAAEAQAYFKALRQQVKCAGEVDPNNMQRAPDGPIR